MKVEHFLTLTQPWATLMAVGAKKVETRSWPIRFRGWFAIHAAKGFPADCQQLCFAQPFAGGLEAAKYRGPADLPLGTVLAGAAPAYREAAQYGQRLLACTPPTL